ncbi:hypothetical protein [Kamptonema formosum]|uniref:hypothetical protein n=1 Tax=Kamptonema formosum TaxID=331992 RepID=UPI0012DDBF0F|nr:hypothetical protein [Oscillatoria sp. PCC 10802]
MNNSAPEIESMFTRVTGGSVSPVDGALRGKGRANLSVLICDQPQRENFWPQGRPEYGRLVSGVCHRQRQRKPVAL